VTSEPTWSIQELKDALIEYEKELRAAKPELSRNTIFTYVSHPERWIRWLEDRSRSTQSAPHAHVLRVASGSISTRTSKYKPFTEWLGQHHDEEVIRLSFDRIEEILDLQLPESAGRYRPWWANQESGTHVHARSWLDAGRSTANVRLPDGRLPDGKWAGGSVDFERRTNRL
jgi:hypothetical protein